MLRPILIPLAALTLGLGVPCALAGQGSPLTVELRGGVSSPVSGFRSGTAVGEGTTSGAVFGVELALASGRRTLYTGFAQARFGCASAGCPSGEPYVATGVNAGARFTLLRAGPVLPWIGLGGLTTRVESPGTAGSPAGPSTLGYGGEASAGLYFATDGPIAFNPAVRMVRVRTELPGGQGLTLRYLVADFALVLQF